MGHIDSTNKDKKKVKTKNKFNTVDIVEERLTGRISLYLPIEQKSRLTCIAIGEIGNPRLGEKKEKGF